ncbi:MAG TPA: hypothetical protein VNK43_08615 [Gemmatimonadales bacterium]|nr:hypothetical protein [Gemmatimonadales bacterium]
MRPSMRFLTRLVGAYGSAGVLALTACSSEPSERQLPTIEDFITRVTTGDGSVEAVLRTGEPPAPGSGEAPAYSAMPLVITGGGSYVTLSNLQPFGKVILAMDGVENYWEITLPATTPSADIIYSVAPRAPMMSFRARYAVVVDGALSPYATQGVQVRQVGVGDVQVSVAWTGDSDVDLHVTDPNGDEVFFGQLQVPSGGRLDLDSNPACNIDGVNNENIVWAENAPRGTYTVVVDYFDDCGVPRSDYVVTIQRKGQPPLTFTGAFIGPGTPVGTQQMTFTY